MFGLGVRLGVSYPAIKNYKRTNHTHGEVTNEGTIKMLFDWRENVSPSEQRGKLHEALRAVGLTGIQEEFLPWRRGPGRRRVSKRGVVIEVVV